MSVAHPHRPHVIIDNRPNGYTLLDDYHPKPKSQSAFGRLESTSKEGQPLLDLPRLRSSGVQMSESEHARPTVTVRPVAQVRLRPQSVEPGFKQRQPRIDPRLLLGRGVQLG